MSSLLSIGSVSPSYPPPVAGRRRLIRSSANRPGAAQEAAIVRRAAEVADFSAGLSAPHPNSGCLIARGGDVVGQGFLYAQGTKCAELQAVEMAGGLARGATAYLNLEPDDCYGDHTPVSSLVQAGILRVVVGLRHPLKHLRGKAIKSLRSEGVHVDVLGEDLNGKIYEEALKSCLVVNAPLLYRTACHVPFSILKYAVTLDGKIATSSGHASWVSSKLSRCRVFELRGRSDAIVVGGNTVRRDDPQLTARHGGSHVPVRIVMSQTLDLPEEAKLWNVFDAYTIVATQRGARIDVQKKLARKGIEVVEFDILNPRDVMEYCYDRGCLSILWECGGALAAPAISSGVIHKVCAFVAPKIIGGLNAPSPVGELGMVQMSQALNLIDVSYEQIGPDMLISGFLQPIPDLSPVIPQADETSALDPTVSPYDTKIISFYKTWDLYGALSNFSPHPVRMPNEDGTCFLWSSVEHYYQAHKFVGVDSLLARDFIQQIKLAKSPEEAARLGRKLQREHPELVCLAANKYKRRWYLDSGYSRHMTGDPDQFFTLERKEGGVVTFGNNDKGNIIGTGKIKITPSTYIDHVLLVDNLKHNLLSIRQLCDNGFKVIFESSLCIVSNPLDESIKFIGHRFGNIYMIDLNEIALKSGQCLVAMNDNIKENSWLWHRRLGHTSMHTISKLISRNLVKGLPKMDFEKGRICDACQLGKQTRGSFKSKNIVSTTRPLELIHMDLFGSTRTASLGGKKYGLVIIDDFTRFTWVLFLAHKDETFSVFKKFYKKVINEKNLTLINIVKSFVINMILDTIFLHLEHHNRMKLWRGKIEL